MNEIAIARFGMVEKDVMEAIVRTVTDSLGADAFVLPSCWPAEHAHNTKRGQYDSSVLLRDLLAIRPSGALRVLGITEYDLFVPALSFVFGQAQLGGTAAILSTARLTPAFYGMPPQPELLVERTAKTVLHELGHTFGLVHCSDRSCAMALATGIAQLDAKLPRYCASCWPRTQGVLT